MVIGRLRHTTLLAWITLAVLSIVGGGQHIVHYTFAHEETHHVFENTCCKPDHRLPHFHEAKYCALCDVDVSVVLHQDAFETPIASCVLVSPEASVVISSPTLRVTTCIDVRGPPVIA